MLHRFLIPLSFTASLAAQAVTTAFNGTFQAVELPSISGLNNYGGTAFVPGNPNLLLVSRLLAGFIHLYGREAALKLVGLHA